MQLIRLAATQFGCNFPHVPVLRPAVPTTACAAPAVDFAVCQVLPRGSRQLPIDVAGLAAGAYCCQVREAQRLADVST